MWWWSDFPSSLQKQWHTCRRRRTSCRKTTVDSVSKYASKLKLCGINFTRLSCRKTRRSDQHLGEILRGRSWFRGRWLPQNTLSRCSWKSSAWTSCDHTRVLQRNSLWCGRRRLLLRESGAWRWRKQAPATRHGYFLLVGIWGLVALNIHRIWNIGRWHWLFLG